ncbi:hypothetical protein BU15DRAFT_80228 [Melanogaster broomeanus]|nr:hypothetical protein BU15DRAFT_80228 [Melanogaster broomeanus]
MTDYTRTLKIGRRVSAICRSSSRPHLCSSSLRSQDLGQEATLVFVFDKFDQDLKGIYNTTHPLVWKVTEFGAHGWYSIEATYSSQLAFIKLGANDGNFTYATTFVPIEMNHQTTLSKNNDHYEFTKPVPLGAQDELPKAVNHCGSVENIAVGFMSAEKPGDAIPVLLHRHVGNGSHVKAQFSPVLRVHIASEYREGQILKREIGTPIWEQDLSGLEDETTWRLRYIEQSGVYTITQTD